MELGRTILSPIPSLPPPPQSFPRAHLRAITAASSVPMSHDQASRPVASMPSASIIRRLPASLLQQEQCERSRTSTREENLAQIPLDMLKIDDEGLSYRKKRHDHSKYLDVHLLSQPVFWYISPPCEGVLPLLRNVEKDPIMDAKSGEALENKNRGPSVNPFDALALAQKAMLATQEAATLAGSCNSLGNSLDESHLPSTVEPVSVKTQMVRSGRLLERQLKKRKISKKKKYAFSQDSSASATSGLKKKTTRSLDSNDPLGLFLWGPETKQLLTLKEERDLFAQIQDLKKIEEVKQRLHMQFSREPTLSEWAEAVGMSCHSDQLLLSNGNRCRDKMIYANFRLVIHVAKQYLGKGLHLQDLLQVGSMGLIKSLEKFKPKAGCRFPTYAYWWIRQSIKKAIFQHSRTIRLPENVFAVLKKIKTERMAYIQEGHTPTNNELARRVGIPVKKLERLLMSSKTPISIQERVWAEQEVSIQEVTADPEVETPDLCIAKQMMRQHVRNLLDVLPVRERQIIHLRFGILGGEKKSLSDIGDAYGLSKERVRQLESRALDNLKGCLDSHGLEAYVGLVI